MTSAPAGHGIDAVRAGSERELLLAFLQRQRELIVWKCAGLDDELARRTATPSGLSAPVLVRHLTGVEHGWLAEEFAGAEPVRERDLEFTARLDEPLADLLAGYEAQWRRSDEIVGAARLDDRCARYDATLRWVLHHLVEETARHLGHLDLLRELADGRVGEEPEQGATS